MDSFAGLPTATTARDDDMWSKLDYVSISLEEVRSHFAAYGLEDEQVSRKMLTLHYVFARLHAQIHHGLAK